MSRGRGRPPHPEILTPAEQRVLDELRKGGTNAEIAERLGVTLDAVKYHISNMLAKLELDNRRELAAWRPERRRLLGVLAVPAWFDSLGRSLGWAGAALGIAAVVRVEALSNGLPLPRPRPCRRIRPRPRRRPGQTIRPSSCSLRGI